MKNSIVFVLLFIIWVGGYQIYSGLKKDYYCSVVFPEAGNVESCVNKFDALDHKNLKEFIERSRIAKTGSIILMCIWIAISIIFSGIVWFVVRKIKLKGKKKIRNPS